MNVAVLPLLPVTVISVFPEPPSQMATGKLAVKEFFAVSKKAFDAISFEEAIAAPKEIYYPKKLARDTAARDEFQKEKGRGSILTETYILDIIRQGWKNDDERLQRVVLG